MIHAVLGSRIRIGGDPPEIAELSCVSLDKVSEPKHRPFDHSATGPRGEVERVLSQPDPASEGFGDEHHDFIPAAQVA